MGSVTKSLTLRAREHAVAERANSALRNNMYLCVVERRIYTRQHQFLLVLAWALLHKILGEIAMFLSSARIGEIVATEWRL